MSSFYDDASLVVIPSGYKTSKVYAEKPTDGSGDLAFTRTGDTATRVNSAGLIEKVRTNYARQSQSFATAAVWTATNGTLTNNAGTAPDGTNTASKIVATDTDPFCYQSITLTGSVVASCYVKAVGSAIGKSAEIRAGVSLTAFTLSGSWQRVSVTHTASAAHNYGLEVPNPGVIGDEVLLWGFQVEGGDVATDYIPTTTAAVSTGPVANVPRLDYLGSTCPRLLLEPQRTNLVTYSEQLGSQTLQGSPTITSNAAVSPDGYTNADKLTPTASGSYTGAFLTSIAAGTYTISMFAKADGKQWVFFYEIGSAGGNNGTWFNVANGTIGNVGAAWSNAKIENYGNGWYRVSATVTFAAGGNFLYWLAADANNSNVLSPNGSDGVLMWGLSYEAGAYATSYIPTLTASATRGADACSKTGISSLIGQTEGTLFAEFTIPTMANTGANLVSISLFNSGITNVTLFDIYDSGNLFAVHVNGTAQASIQKTSFTAGRHKVAFGYKANDFVLYVDGVLVGTDTSGTVGAQDSFGLQYGTSQFIGQQYVNQALVFKTRLTNAELAELTTL